MCVTQACPGPLLLTLPPAHTLAPVNLFESPTLTMVDRTGRSSLCSTTPRARQKAVSKDVLLCTPHQRGPFGQGRTPPSLSRHQSRTSLQPRPPRRSHTAGSCDSWHALVMAPAGGTPTGTNTFHFPFTASSPLQLMAGGLTSRAHIFAAAEAMFGWRHT